MAKRPLGYLRSESCLKFADQEVAAVSYLLAGVEEAAAVSYLLAGVEVALRPVDGVDIARAAIESRGGALA